MSLAGFQLKMRLLRLGKVEAARHVLRADARAAAEWRDSVWRMTKHELIEVAKAMDPAAAPLRSLGLMTREQLVRVVLGGIE